MFPLDRATIFLTLAGSHAQGTARDGSDVDLRGVCVAPRAVRLSLFNTFEQLEGELPPALASRVWPQLQAHPTAGAALDQKVECVIYDVAKFVSLCANANPNALEILFADTRDWVLVTPTWRLLYDARHLFLTRKVQHTFLGYAMSQLKRIQTHRAWLLNPPARKPTRAQFGLPDANDAGHREAPNAAQYRAAMKRWDAYQSWSRHRNRARAKLEAAHGYDTKHAMHLIRLMRMGVEVLERGELLVRRPDAAELSEIRDGALTFDELHAIARDLERQIDVAASTSTLPAEIDRDEVDRLALQLMTTELT